MPPKLYHCKRSRSMRPLWALEELGIKYELITMKFPPRVNYEGYLEINSLGTVPTLVDGSATLTESSAILHFLVDKYGPTDLAVLPSDNDYGSYLNWLHRSDATLTFPQTLVLRYSKLEPKERQVPQVVEDYKKWFFSRLRAVEQSLENRDYLCSNRFTIADISVCYALVLAESLGLSDGFKINTKRYFEMLKKRPAFVRAFEL
ncbi:MAG: glutathione S-transferase family protein [Gammaproteobacteria bacterium]|nr:glutathione S-transferase family protein [Gammaproteobacteria bacterium]